MSHSSIFSFDTLRPAGLRPYGAMVAFAILAAVEIFVARNEKIWSFAQNSQPGIVDAMESMVINKVNNPTIIVLGDSRDRDAIIPGLLASELGLAPGEVLNLSLTAGIPYDSLTLYRRNRAKLSQAALIVLGLDDFSLQRLKDTERVRRFSTLQERWQHFSGETRASLIVGYFWRTFDAYKQFGRLAKQLLLQPDRTVAIGPDGRVEWRKENAEFLDDAEDMAKRLYGKGAMEFDSWEVKELLKLCAADGVKVILYRPPLSDAFRNHRDGLWPEATAKYEAHLEPYTTDPPVVAVMVDDDPGSVGITPDEFFDYGHLRQSGAERSTSALADKIRERGILSPVPNGRQTNP